MGKCRDCKGAIRNSESLSIQDKKNYVLQRMKYYYDGYKFHERGPSIFNPLLLLSCFQTNKFGNYWADTARSTRVLNLIKDIGSFNKIGFDDYTTEATSDQLSYIDATYNKLSMKAFLYQTGYLSIKGHERLAPEGELYYLGFANHEVKQYLREQIKRINIELAEEAGKRSISPLSLYFKTNAWAPFFSLLYRYCFSSIPYDCFVMEERVYQGMCNSMLRGAGIPISGENHNHLGRADGLILEMDQVCIIEYKLNGVAVKAFNQAYTLYTHSHWSLGKNVVVMGINFRHGDNNSTPNHHNIDSVHLKVFSSFKEHLSTFSGHFENGDLVTDETWEKYNKD